MKPNELVIQRFSELEEQLKKLPIIPGDSQSSPYVDSQSWQKWTTSVLNILERIFKKDSSHYTNFKYIYDKKGNNLHALREATGVFLAAKEDYENNYLFTLESSLTGELLGDFVTLAKEALTEGYKDVAAVLASAALEDTLKKYATSKGLEVGTKNMHEVVNALKSEGLVTGAQKSLLDIMPKLRDYAMHANWDKITPAEAGGIIGFVENFLLSHFSS
jgi:hypothetical protein